jgi:hypothetical protein
MSGRRAEMRAERHPDQMSARADFHIRCHNTRLARFSAVFALSCAIDMQALDERARSGNFAVKRQATWEMSAQHTRQRTD